MRSVEPRRHTAPAGVWCVLPLLGALAAGCGSVPGASSGAPSAAATTAAPASVDPAVQQAFDDARRALAAGQTQQAEQGFVALARAHPEFGGPHAALGVMYRQAGKLDAATAELEQAVRASPRQPAYLNELGVCYRMQGRFDQARLAYEQALAVAPDYRDVVLNLGILNDLYLADGGRALDLYERYLQLSPEGDATVAKWVVELRSRTPQSVAANRKGAS